MGIKKLQPGWVAKVLLLSYAAQKYPHIKKQIDRLILDAEELAKKEAIKRRGIDGQ